MVNCNSERARQQASQPRPNAHLDQQGALEALEAQAKSVDPLDVRVHFTNAGLPQEAVQELVDLCSVRRRIGTRVVHIGRVVVDEIARFVEANPHLAIGVAVGAAIGALTSMIPLVGSMLAPLATLLGVIVGGVAGLRLDEGRRTRGGVLGVTQDLIVLAKKFFAFLVRLVRAAMQEQLPGDEVPA